MVVTINGFIFSITLLKDLNSKDTSVGNYSRRTNIAFFS